MIMRNTQLKFYFLFFIVSFLCSCAAPIKKEAKKIKLVTPEPVAAPVIVKKPEPVPSKPKDIFILSSGSSNAYQKINNYLVSALGERALAEALSGLPEQDNAIVEKIKNSDVDQIVAVGLKAIEALKNIKDKQIVYTQVINHKKLISKNIKAVSSLPSPEKLFKDWKKLSPRLSKVAVITGKGLGTYLRRAKKAAKAQGVKLVVETVNSDKSFIYKSKKLKADVGGQWILPDNRILSGKALKEVMAYASRRGRQVVVFSPKLLSFGGFFYVTPDLQAIANGVLQRLAESTDEPYIVGDSILPVMNHTMGINQNIARQLNLTIPQKYRKYINGK